MLSDQIAQILVLKRVILQSCDTKVFMGKGLFGSVSITWHCTYHFCLKIISHCVFCTYLFLDNSIELLCALYSLSQLFVYQCHWIETVMLYGCSYFLCFMWKENKTIKVLGWATCVIYANTRNEVSSAPCLESQRAPGFCRQLLKIHHTNGLPLKYCKCGSWSMCISPYYSEVIPGLWKSCLFQVRIIKVRLNILPTCVVFSQSVSQSVHCQQTSIRCFQLS